MKGENEDYGFWIKKERLHVAFEKDCRGGALFGDNNDCPARRFYGRNAGEHHYTTSAAERDNLIKAGWKYEGIGWYSDDAQSVPLYRLYNPNEYNNNHHYTTSTVERDHLLSLGWKDEGMAWYGVEK